MRPSPRKSRPHALLSAFVTAIAVAVPLVLLAAQGCGLQGEGQRCSKETAPTHDGSEDCAAGLKCISVLGASSDICCPENGASDNLNCQAQNNGAGGGATSPTSAATTGTSTGTSTSTGTGTGAGGSGGGGGGTSTSTGTSTGTSTSTATSTSTGTGAGGAGGGP